MSTRYASEKNAIGICDRCGMQFKLKDLREEIVKARKNNLRVCKTCFDPDHPQLQVGMRPVFDPQALRHPRPDNSYVQGGLDADGDPSLGSRVIEWGWAPVGVNNPLGLTGLTNALVAVVQVGTVSVTIGD